jgi:histone demethylase JARID1
LSASYVTNGKFTLLYTLIWLTHVRYHGKCLKIARGKVKEDEKYTCPICDWRVRIPRDAARPKLEDLQSWQDEIPTLPFQPDEEQILEKIINNAQEFRQHVAPFCNPVMATAEEAETQRFYLRKIEGAEILLAYETNFFRQELHKWSPVAPEPPPVLESSKSTRKPRPTKLQKLMAQHGVDDPEALPQSLRTKPHTFKRKSSEPQSARPQPLQPAPGRSDAGPPGSHYPENPSMHPSLSGSVLTGLHEGSSHAHPPNFGYSSGPDLHYSTSPRDGPHPFLNNGGLQSLGYGSVSPRQSAMFNDRGFGGIDSVATLDEPGSPGRDDGFGTLTSSSHGLSGGAEGPSGGSQDLKQMFNDLTNQADEDDSQSTKPKIESREKDRERDGESKWEEGDDMELFFDGP